MPFYQLFLGEGSPTKIDTTEKSWYPNSNLSTGGLEVVTESPFASHLAGGFVRACGEKGGLRVPSTGDRAWKLPPASTHQHEKWGSIERDSSRKAVPCPFSSHKSAYGAIEKILKGPLVTSPRPVQLLNKQVTW